MTSDDALRKALADERAEALARQLLRGLAEAQVLEADGINSMAHALYDIARRSTDERIRPGAVTLLREIADKLEAQDEAAELRAQGRAFQ